MDNNELRDYESGIKNSEMENCSNDGGINGNNLMKKWRIICKKSFGRKFDMEKHMEYVHEEKKKH